MGKKSRRNGNGGGSSATGSITTAAARPSSSGISATSARPCPPVPPPPTNVDGARDATATARSGATNIFMPDDIEPNARAEMAEKLKSRGRNAHLEQDARVMKGSGPASRGPLIEPGRSARITNLVHRNDLNGKRGTIKHMIPGGSWAVEFVEKGGTDSERRELVAIPRKNLEILWRMNKQAAQSSGMDELGECSICLDTEMDRGNAGVIPCCGAWICNSCDVKICKMDTCPMCRGDTSDLGASALEGKLLARAKRGDANAMHNLAGRYDAGADGFRCDQALARVWYRRATDRGYARAAHDLGCSHRDGEGGPVDHGLAARYFRMAAERGHIPACTNLGISLMNGTGVEVDKEEARAWLKRGVEAGDELAVQKMSILDTGHPNVSFRDMMRMMQYGEGR